MSMRRSSAFAAARSSLAVLASAGENDFLITGDMDAATEAKLLETYDLPDIEALAAGHHGSKYATSQALLEALQSPIFMAYHRNQPFNDNMLRP